MEGNNVGCAEEVPGFIELNGLLVCRREGWLDGIETLPLCCIVGNEEGNPVGWFIGSPDGRVDRRTVGCSDACDNGAEDELI